MDCENVALTALRQQVDDLRAVLEAVDADQVSIIGGSEMASITCVEKPDAAPRVFSGRVVRA